MKGFFFAVTVSMLLACNSVKAITGCESHEHDHVVKIPQEQWDQALVKLRSCKIVDIDLDITATPYGFHCNDWMIYADSDKVSEITLIEIEGIKYLPEKSDGKP